MSFFKKVTLGAVLCALLVSQKTAVASEEDYSWRNQMAAIEKAVDSYRLVLRELENILAQMNEESVSEQAKSAEWHNLWKTNMGQSYKGLNGSKSDDLPLLVKMIHQNLLDQFESATEWDDASRFSGILESIIINFQVIEEQIKLYERYGKLSSGFYDNIRDADEVLDQLNEAILNVQHNLLAINKSAQQEADSGDKYQLLVNLNQSLKVMLEIMAEAGNIGIDIGFTPQMISPEYSKKIGLFSQRLGKVKEQWQLLQTPIEPYQLDMTAKCMDGSSNGIPVRMAVGRLLTVEKIKNPGEMRPFLLVEKQPVILDGSSWKEVGAPTRVERRPFNSGDMINDTIPGGDVYQYIFKIGTMAGNYSTAESMIVVCPATELAAPATISAEAAINGSWKDDLTQDRTLKAYRDLDVLEISWPLSPSEQLPRKERNLLGNSLDHYELYRSISEEEFEKIADLPPGTTFYQDRVDLDRLLRTRSVRYQLKVVDRQGQVASGPISNSVKGDWDVWFEVAKSGYFEYTNNEMDAAVSKAIELYPEYIIEAARKWLNGVGHDDYPEVLARYWARAPEQMKIKWYGDEQKLRLDGNSLCLQNGPDNLIERDFKRVSTEIWLAFQPDVVSMEPARWWQSLSSKQQEKYLEKWWKQQNPDYLDSLQVNQTQAVKDDNVPVKPSSPWTGLSVDDLSSAVVVSWVDSLDSIEQDFLKYFWEKIPADTKAVALTEWWSEQPEAYRRQVCYPAFNGLNKDEQAQYLNSGYEILSPEVQAKFLPYVYFEAASWGAKQDVIHHVEDRSRAHSRQMLFVYKRPLDVLCGFQLTKVLSIILAVLLLLVGGRIFWKKRQDKF